MVAVNNDDTVALYSKSIANFWAAYTITQELVKTQGKMIASMQTQLQAMHQYCMGLQKQPPPHHLRATAASTGRLWIRPLYPVDRRQGRRRISSPVDDETSSHPTPDAIQAPQELELLPHARWDITIAHTSQTCHWPGPNHNCTTTRTNTQGGLPAGLHKVILPLAAGLAPPPQQQQRAPTQAMWPQPPSPATYTAVMTTMCPTMPAAPYQQAIYHVGQQMGPQAMYHGGQPVGPPFP
jgi:hypothetical protein